MSSAKVHSGISHLNGVQMFHDDGAHLVEQFLPALAKLFINHKMNESYAIGYLHRHFDIPETSIWVHEEVDDADKVTAKGIEELGSKELFPYSYALEDGSFKTFEWSFKPMLPKSLLTQDFLDDLKQFANDNGLKDYLAIFPRTNKVMIESMLAEGGQISYPEDPSKSLPASTTIEDTQWVFDAPSTDTKSGILGSDPPFKTQQRCTKNVHGFHFVHDDKPASVTEASPLSGEPTFKTQQRCTKNVHGFHFVHDD